ncbi:aspartate/tyrosine/aromatic aminotransferase [Pseudomaricurvus alkylphenolicus]|uniref:amino acid aminotransferase n=1 Tax=Pseudomaricurvus alkylphenolicus TaxID=1306991 RepID=UPI00142026AB|nr:amino acid aminotransferase [Pseudomaricurvus alkylphenolicus]NIB43569.1 aspartate/tyrosine/aromatic aminotransferase [Pseudomaricurvus alkylphenolicus]
MFEQLQPLPTDPILGLTRAYQEDPNPSKVDLGVGVYKDEQGNTPVLQSVRKALEVLHQQEMTKAYQGMSGNVGFNQALQSLIFGGVEDDRIRTLQAPGGCGALRLAAELVVRSNPGAAIWVSTPTWANHIPLLGNAGVEIKEYPYFDAATSTVDFEAMRECLSQVSAGDLVLLHGCCHNPTGADLSDEQWGQVANLAVERGFVPFVDLAYQGFGAGIMEDVAGLRAMAAKVPEMLVVSSCSKNFGLYRERTGALSVMAASPSVADTAISQLHNAARGIYSMPPAHGAGLVELILTTDSLRQMWINEVDEMRNRIQQLRNDLAGALQASGDFSFISRQRGMFSFLGLDEAQVERLQKEFSVYMVGSSRINIAGINRLNLDYLAHSIAAVL